MRQKCKYNNEYGSWQIYLNYLALIRMMLETCVVHSHELFSHSGFLTSIQNLFSSRHMIILSIGSFILFSLQSIEYFRVVLLYL